MAKIHRCPKCSERATLCGTIDSHGRIKSAWLHCNYCGWDQRDGKDTAMRALPVQPQS